MASLAGLRPDRTGVRPRTDHALGPALDWAEPTLDKPLTVQDLARQSGPSTRQFARTFPGSGGIPMKDGKPTVCVPDPQAKECVAPYVDHADVNGGGPHSAFNAAAGINGGTMNGSIG